MIVATLLEPSLASLQTAVRETDVHADAFEVRLDALREPVSPQDLRRLTSKPLIVTYRSTGAAEERSDAAPDLEPFLRAGAEFVDGRPTIDRPEMILSYHAWSRTPPIREILGLAKRCPPSRLFKFASSVRTFDDTLRLLVAARRLQGERRRFAVMGLGDFPRALGHLFGNTLVYGGARSCAPGQPFAKDVQDTLARWGLPRSAARTYLVVGSPVAASRSPRIHNAAFRRLKVAANFGALEVKDARALRSLFRRAQALAVEGVSVTSPLKEAAAQLVDELGPNARGSGSVNCVRFQGDRTYGEDADGPAAAALVAALPKTPRRILIVGTGGVSRALCHAFQGFDTSVCGRNPDRLRFLAAEFGVQPLSQRPPSLQGFHLLVNATKVEDPFPLHGYDDALYDLHYASGPTSWERFARANGNAFVSGLDHLVEQARLSQRHWLGRAADASVMYDAARGDTP